MTLHTNSSDLPTPFQRGAWGVCWCVRECLPSLSVELSTRSEVHNTVPMNWSFDYFGGVSFEKGCYLGQELVARTKHSVRLVVSSLSLGGAF